MGQVGRDHVQAVAGEEGAVVAGARADLQQPAATVAEHAAEEQFPLGELPRLLLLLVAPCGPAVVGDTQAAEHVLVPCDRPFRVGRHHRPASPRLREDPTERVLAEGRAGLPGGNAVEWLDGRRTPAGTAGPG